MPDTQYPSSGGIYERDSKGNLKQVEAPTRDATYDRGNDSSPTPDIPVTTVDKPVAEK